jgi:hypothetical protein
MQFMIDTSGLNSYAHAFMMPSGKMFLQANVSAMLWNPDTFEEARLPDVPGGVIRVYPASGGVAMLPLTPENNYNPTSSSAVVATCLNMTGVTTPGPSSIPGWFPLPRTVNASPLSHSTDPALLGSKMTT